MRQVLQLEARAWTGSRWVTTNQASGYTMSDGVESQEMTGPFQGPASRGAPTAKAEYPSVNS